MSYDLIIFITNEDNKMIKKQKHFFTKAFEKAKQGN